MARMRDRPSGWYLFGAVTVIGAAAWEVLRAHMPPAVLWAEVGLFSLGAGYAGVVILSESKLRRLGTIGEVATTTVNAVLSGAILAIAAPYLPDAVPFAFSVLAIVVLSSIVSSQWQRESAAHPMLATMCGEVALGAVWIRSGSVGGLDGLLLWAALLAGFGALAEVHWRRGRTGIAERLGQLEILVREAQRLGSSADLFDIASTVLEAFSESYPHLDWGAILMFDKSSKLLQPLPFALTPKGIRDLREGGSPGVEVRPNEGLAGIAFARGEIQVRQTASDFLADSDTRSAVLSGRIESSIGVLRSGIAMPLRNAMGETIGVLSLVSSTAEFNWTQDDLLLARGLSEQCGVALERGRLYDSQRRDAVTDHLTRLPNRREFERLLTQLDLISPYTLLAIDLDNLKMINDEHGHEAGDAVLRVVAQALRQGLRSQDILARVGGDEFAALLPATDDDVAADIARRLTSSMLGVAVPFGTARVSVGCAGGAAGTNPRDTWSAADEALYRAKVQGRNRVETVSSGARAGEGAHSRWSELLPQVLDARGIEAVYQPIVELEGHSVLGYEALARLRGSDAGVEALFGAALRLGLARDMDWLCRRAALQDSHGLDRGALLFINVGIPALLDPLHDVDQMLLLLSWVRRSPSEVVLELSEREVVTDMGRLREVLSAYRVEGFRFALDDVGEGHSTLEVLAQSAPEYIKIARQLVRRADQPGPRSAIRALATFAHDYGAGLIAEGMETVEDEQAMHDLGVMLGQGYRLGRPGRGYGSAGLSEPVAAAAS